ncbi:MAG: flagellar biosynthetic protein FliO, partial [Candidatus Limnocylindria bacterium]
ERTARRTERPAAPTRVATPSGGAPPPLPERGRERQQPAPPPVADSGEAPGETLAQRLGRQRRRR